MSDIRFVKCSGTVSSEHSKSNKDHSHMAGLLYSMGDCVLCHVKPFAERAQVQNNKHTTLKSVCLLFCSHTLRASQFTYLKKVQS